MDESALDEHEARRRRARERRSRMTGGLGRLEDSGRPPVADTPEARLREVFRISRDAWILSGREWPSYSRADMPGRLIRGDEG